MLGEPGMGPNVVQEPFVRPESQSFQQWRKRLVAWILHLSATDPKRGDLTFKLSSRDLVQMMAERGIALAHTAEDPFWLELFVG
jgi:hypothetical protein